MAFGLSCSVITTRSSFRVGMANHSTATFLNCWKPLQAQLPKTCVLDGEIVIAGSSGLDFDALQLRIHPAASRVKLLSQQTPASVVFFDLLSESPDDLLREPFELRRKKLESLFFLQNLRSTLRRPHTKRRSLQIGSDASRGGTRWRHGQAGDRHLRIGQTRHAEGEA
jgi:hypothetical protein